MPNPRLTRKDLIALAAVYLIWGSTYLAIKWSLVSFPALLGTGMRFLCAGVLLMAWCRWRGHAWPAPVQWRNAAVVGSIVLGGGTGSVALAETSVSSAHVAVLIGCSPLVACLWTGLFGRWPTWREWAGVLIGTLGAVLLASRGEMASQPQGIALTVLAMCCWTFGSVLSQHRLPTAPGAMGFASEMLGGGVFLILLGWLHGDRMSGWPQAQALAAWSYLVTFGAIVGFSAFKYLLARHPPALAFSYAYVNPLVAVVLGVVLGGESFSVQELLATLVIVGAVAMTVSGRKAAPAQGHQDHPDR